MAERRDLLHHVLGVRAHLGDARSELVLLRCRIEIVDQEPAEADYRADHVVEVVRDAAGEAADGLHLGRLSQLVLHPTALGDVEREAAETDNLAGPVHDRELQDLYAFHAGPRDNRRALDAGGPSTLQYVLVGGATLPADLRRHLLVGMADHLLDRAPARSGVRLVDDPIAPLAVLQ